MTSIWWIRRDLRLTDNAALRAAQERGPVIPVFILDPAFAHSSARRKDFLYEGLHVLDRDLRARGSYLVIRAGKPVEVLQKLLVEADAQVIFAEEDFTHYSRKRDETVARGLPLQLIDGQTVHHPLMVLKKDGKPYTVFTPYAKVWKERLPFSLQLYPAPETIETPAGISSATLPKYKISPLFPAGEEEALVRLEEFLHRRIYAYNEDRDRMDLDGTSQLSPYLRFGMLGLRQAVGAAKQAAAEAKGDRQRTSPEVWLNELIWREFNIQILYHFPYIRQAAYNRRFANLRWRNEEKEFDAWKEGSTGVPIVDAGMRQLKEVGWMHNRARMITASHLVKDMLIDWRRGEAWFMEHLLDGDISANNGGWQWIAGTGVSAAPYFRIFNPVIQSRKFDPNGDYIRKWVPELYKLDAADIHAPWEKGIRVRGYPEKPIVEHNPQRTRRAYRLAKQG